MIESFDWHDNGNHSKPSPYAHTECPGFDNQDTYWHCYTHDLYNNAF